MAIHGCTLSLHCMLLDLLAMLLQRSSVVMRSAVRSQ